MSDTSPNLRLPYIQPAQAQKHVTHNESLDLLDMLVQTRVEARDATVPPAAPDEGETYALGAAPTGAWSGYAFHLASYNNAGWLFAPLTDGTVVWDRAAPGLFVWSAGVWVATLIEGTSLAAFGVNTEADTTNRLAVAAEAVLLSHDGSDHQLKLNKALPTDTVSAVFQSGFSGRAELGLAGSDTFSIKVSDDGTGWHTPFVFDGTSGTVSGTAVQSSKTDVSTGRLARSDFAYGPGNLLAPVAMNGGTPDGGVLERGSTANGAFVKWADGTMICLFDAALFTQASADTMTFAWTFPAQFIAAPSIVETLPTTGWTDVTPGALSVLTTDGGSSTSTLTLHRAEGAAAFLGTAAISPVQVVAVGRWI